MRNSVTLDKKQKAYINRISFGPFMLPFYAVFRKQYWVLVVYVINFGLIQIPKYLLKAFPVDLNIELSHSLPYQLFIFFTYFVNVLFPLIHILYAIFGRRLSWNTCKWKDFPSYVKSEKIWNILGFLSFLFILYLYYYIYYQRFVLPQLHPEWFSIK